MSSTTKIYGTDIVATRIVEGGFCLNVYSGPDLVHQVWIRGHADGDGVERMDSLGNNICSAVNVFEEVD